MVGGLRDLQNSAGLGDGLTVGNQLVSRFDLADDLLGCVTGSFDGGVASPVWPDENSHSPWTDFWGPRHPTSEANDGTCPEKPVHLTECRG